MSGFYWGYQIGCIAGAVSMAIGLWLGNKMRQQNPGDAEAQDDEQ